MYVCLRLLIASHFHADWVKRCADGAGYWKGNGRGSSANENLASGGGYTSLFISSDLKNFHITRNEQQLLC